MKLDKLHILKRHTRPIGQCHIHTGINQGIRAIPVDTPDTARGKDYNPGLECLYPSANNIQRNHTHANPVFNHKVCH